MYTNKTASNLNLNLYSKQFGGTKCIQKCKQKCSENCGHFCRVASDDHDEHNEQYKKLEAKVALLRQRAAQSEQTKLARTISSYQNRNRNTTINSDLIHKILSSRNTTNEEKALLLRTVQSGGRKTRRFRKRKVRGGFGFLGNTSEYKPCEDDCTTTCSTGCEITCENAVSKTSIHKEKIKLMKAEIELLEKLIRSNSY